MDDVIALGIDAKHSNEDAIAAYDEWIARYSERLACWAASMWIFCASDTG